MDSAHELLLRAEEVLHEIGPLLNQTLESSRSKLLDDIDAFFSQSLEVSHNDSLRENPKPKPFEEYGECESESSTLADEYDNHLEGYRENNRESSTALNYGNVIKNAEKCGPLDMKAKKAFTYKKVIAALIDSKWLLFETGNKSNSDLPFLTIDLYETKITSKKNKFLIKMPKDSYEFRCTDDEDKQQWLKCLDQVLKRRRRTDTAKPGLNRDASYDMASSNSPLRCEQEYNEPTQAAYYERPAEDLTDLASPKDDVDYRLAMSSAYQCGPLEMKAKNGLSTKKMTAALLHHRLVLFSEGSKAENDKPCLIVDLTDAEVVRKKLKFIVNTACHKNKSHEFKCLNAADLDRWVQGIERARKSYVPDTALQEYDEIEPSFSEYKSSDSQDLSGPDYDEYGVDSDSQKPQLPSKGAVIRGSEELEVEVVYDVPKRTSLNSVPSKEFLRPKMPPPPPPPVLPKPPEPAKITFRSSSPCTATLEKPKPKEPTPFRANLTLGHKSRALSAATSGPASKLSPVSPPPSNFMDELKKLQKSKQMGRTEETVVGANSVLMGNQTSSSKTSELDKVLQKMQEQRNSRRIMNTMPVRMKPQVPKKPSLSHKALQDLNVSPRLP